MEVVLTVWIAENWKKKFAFNANIFQTNGRSLYNNTITNEQISNGDREENEEDEKDLKTGVSSSSSSKKWQNTASKK